MKVNNLKTVLLLVAVTVVFVGCSKDDEPNAPKSSHSIVGTWFWSGGDYDWVDGYKEVTQRFHSNGKFEVSVYYFPDDETEEDSGTYKVNGNKITLACNLWEHYNREDFFEIGKDSKGDYLIFYVDDKTKEQSLIEHKHRRIAKE